QHTVVCEIIEAMRAAIATRDPIVETLIDEATKDLSQSLRAAQLPIPPAEVILQEVRDAFGGGALMTQKVNSDNDVMALLDDNAELKLRTPYSIFIGGQILDRGITVPNLIGFYYGRSPTRMQQNTV